MTTNNRFSGSFGHAADQEKSIPKSGQILETSLMGKKLSASTAFTLLDAIGHAVDAGRFDAASAATQTHAASLVVGSAGGGIATDASRVASADKFETYKPQADNERMFGRSDAAPKAPVGLG